MKAKEKPRILVNVCGGVVQAIYSNVPGIKVEVFDIDDLKAEGVDGETIDKNWEAKKQGLKEVW